MPPRGTRPPRVDRGEPRGDGRRRDSRRPPARRSTRPRRVRRRSSPRRPASASRLGEHVDEAVVGSEGGAERPGAGSLRDLAGEVDVHVVARREQQRHHDRVACASPRRSSTDATSGCCTSTNASSTATPRRRTAAPPSTSAATAARPSADGRAVRCRDERGRAASSVELHLDHAADDARAIGAERERAVGEALARAEVVDLLVQRRGDRRAVAARADDARGPSPARPCAGRGGPPRTPPRRRGARGRPGARRAGRPRPIRARGRRPRTCAPRSWSSPIVGGIPAPLVVCSDATFRVFPLRHPGVSPT